MCKDEFRFAQVAQFLTVFDNLNPHLIVFSVLIFLLLNYTTFWHILSVLKWLT